ncbi:uncharacterized protein METZ01_LOCUS63277, partial [marine metagenome]
QHEDLIVQIWNKVLQSVHYFVDIYALGILAVSTNFSIASTVHWHNQQRDRQYIFTNKKELLLRKAC